MLQKLCKYFEITELKFVLIKPVSAPSLTSPTHYHLLLPYFFRSTYIYSFTNHEIQKIYCSNI